MSTGELSKLVKKLIDDKEARQSFIDDSQAFVKQHMPDISVEILEPFCTLSDKNIDDLTKGLNVENDKIKIQAKSAAVDDVEVICACGAGYWYQ